MSSVPCRIQAPTLGMTLSFTHSIVLLLEFYLFVYRNGWGASVVDALTTAIIMRSQPAVVKQLEFIAKIDFTKSKDTVSLFETTIRYLGGLLSGYDLLTGPYADLVAGVRNPTTPIPEAEILTYMYPSEQNSCGAGWKASRTGRNPSNQALFRLQDPYRYSSQQPQLRNKFLYRYDQRNCHCWHACS